MIKYTAPCANCQMPGKFVLGDLEGIIMFIELNNAKQFAEKITKFYLRMSLRVSSPKAGMKFIRLAF
jgi:hypothetical protein